MTVAPMERPVAAVSFDATGTLIHCPRLGEIYSEVLERHGYAVDPARARRLVLEVWQELSLRIERGEDRFSSHPEGPRGWWRRLLERFCEHLGAERPSRFAAAELYDRFSHGASWEVYPDVVPTLEVLRSRRLELAVIANWDERLPGLLEDVGLGGYFETIVTSQGAGVEKPHPLIFQTALAVLDRRAEEVLHVGDRRLEDVEGAEALGMRALLLSRSGGDGLDGLDEVLRSRHLQAAC